MGASVGYGALLTRIPTIDDVISDHATASRDDLFAYRKRVSDRESVRRDRGTKRDREDSCRCGLPRPRDLDERHIRLHRAIHRARTCLPGRRRA